MINHITCSHCKQSMKMVNYANHIKLYHPEKSKSFALQQTTTNLKKRKPSNTITLEYNDINLNQSDGNNILDIDQSDHDNNDEVNFDNEANITEPSNIVYDYQTILISLFSDCEFRTRNLQKGTGNDKLHSIDYLELANLESVIKFSDSQGDLILETFNNIIRRNKVKSFSFPKRWSTIKRSVFDKQLTNKYDNLYKIHIFETPLDNNFFNDTNNIKKPYGVGFDILQIIGEQLLRCDPKKFNFQHVKQLNNAQEQVFGHFCTSEYFHKAFDSLGKRFDRNETFFDGELRPIIPLCISFSIDETTLTYNSKIIEPIIMSILNIDSPKALFLGFTPKFPYSNATLNELLLKKYPAKTTRHKIIRYLKRKIKLDYFEHLLENLRKLDKCGFICQIGSDEDKVIAHCFPYITMIVADNKASNEICSIIGNGKGMGRRCRICNCNKLYELSNELEYRDPKIIEDILSELNVLSTNSSITAKRAIEYKILPGSNFFIKVGNHNLKHNITKGFHDLFPPDFLHTLLLGIVLNCISWCVNIIVSIDQIHGSQILSSIDWHVQNFTLLSVSPYISCNFADGISKHFQPKKNACEKGTGMVSGCIPAWKLPDLLFKLLFAIDANMNVIKTCNNSNKLLKTVKIFDIISLACTSVLYLTWLLKTVKQYSDVDLENLSKVIKQCRLYMFQLYELKGYLLSYIETKGNCFTFDKYEKPIFNDIKSHLLEHIPRYIKIFGIHETNTEKAELHHKEIKKQYHSTNKNTKVDIQIVKQIKKKLFISAFKDIGLLKSKTKLKEMSLNSDYCFKRTHGTSAIVLKEFPISSNSSCISLRPYVSELITLNIFKQKFNQFIENKYTNEDIVNYQFSFYNAITCSGNKDLESFIIHANNSYKKYEIVNPFFSNLEVSYADSEEYVVVKVLAILGIKNKSEDIIKFNLFIAKLEETKEVGLRQHLPYSVYQYIYNYGIHPEFIEVEAVNFPSCIIPFDLNISVTDSKTSIKYKSNPYSETLNNIKTLKYYKFEVFSKDYFQINAYELNLPEENEKGRYNLDLHEEELESDDNDYDENCDYNEIEE